ncbi:MAG: hypothetical protein MR866_02035 [Selenomonadaceae bacterium]|nr:hypothetical protein [Selenomonadaceae bacterium]
MIFGASFYTGSFDNGADVGPFIFDVDNGNANANNGFRLAKDDVRAEDRCRRAPAQSPFLWERCPSHAGKQEESAVPLCHAARREA